MKHRYGRLTRRLAKNKYVYLMILPGFLFCLVFAYFPLGGLYMAFSDYKLGQPLFGAEFAGLEYFRQVFSDLSGMLSVLRNTVGINLLSLAVGLSAAIIFAIMLNEVQFSPFKRVVQTASFFPFFVSWVIVYNIFNTFLASESGLINVWAEKIGLIDQGLNILGDPKYSWGLIVLSNLWKGLGYNTVLFLSAITGIDPTLYEAAEIDGADRLQRIRYITLPALLPTLQILLILNVGWILGSNFDQFYLFTNTMNRSTMLVFDMQIYDLGMKHLRYSYATAVGIVKSLAGLVLLLTVNAVSKKINKTSVL